MTTEAEKQPSEVSHFLAVDRQVRLAVSPAMLSAAHKAGFDIDTEKLVYVAGGGRFLVNTPLKGIETLIPKDLNKGVNLLFIHLSVPQDTKMRGMNRDILSGFYIVQIEQDLTGARAHLLDIAGNLIDEVQLEAKEVQLKELGRTPVAEDITVTTSGGIDRNCISADINITIGHHFYHFRFQICDTSPD
jgi:hypothetical protein